MSDDRIPIFISMGEAKCIGHASRTLSNLIYRQNLADLHTEKVEIAPKRDAYTDDEGKEHPEEPPTYADKVSGLKLKPFTVMAVTLERGRVSRKVILEERAAEPEPFPEGVAVDAVAAPKSWGGITVGADDWEPTQGMKNEAMRAVPMEIQGMGQKEIDQLAAQHIADISDKMGGGRNRPLVSLIQSRAYSGHAWEWGDTHLDLDEVWSKLDDRGKQWLYDEIMALVQEDSPTPAQKESTTKKLVGPGDATYDEMRHDHIDAKLLHRRD